ncbi:MAG: DUF4258 domain-containing protein [Chloroflexi bacterium]|nr:DUF4258 domain-containing protein [Chloroflexota bacterium]
MESGPGEPADAPKAPDRVKPRYIAYTYRRMAERGITEEQIEYVLRNYDTRRPSPPYRNGEKPSEIFIGDCDGRRLKVYVERDSDPPFIKTAVWEGD